MKYLISIFAMLFVNLALAWQPTKPIEVMVAWPAGSVNDLIIRTLAPHIEQQHNVKFVITNRPGAGGVVGTEQFSKMPTDGHHINIVSLGGLTAMDRTVPAFWNNRPYTLDNFEYVTILASSPMAIIAAKDDPVTTPRELIQILKTGSVSVGDSGGGGRLSLSKVLIQSGAISNQQLIRASYQGPAQTLTDVGGKHVRFGIVPLSVAAPHHLNANGNIKIVALTSKTNHPALSNVGNISDVIPGFASPANWGLMVPKGTPTQSIDWYSKVFKEALTSSAMKNAWATNFLSVDEKLLDSKSFTTYVYNLEKEYTPIVNIILQEVQKQK